MSGTRGPRKEQLEFLFRKQQGKCHICGEPAVLDFQGGHAGRHLSAVRFRIGSSFGEKGRCRPRVMAHRSCAQSRSDQIQASQPIEELWIKSRRQPIKGSAE
jgi:hypothetical protein